MYNPITIIWRYFVIIDRRVRAKNWTPLTMAASNTVFWTAKGWDGSEKMIQKSREHCLRTPRLKHIDLLSATAAKTVIVTLQGIQAIYSLTVGTQTTTPESNVYGNAVALNTIFVPLAILGLFRLLPAFWLAEDYSFANFEGENNSTAKAEQIRINDNITGDESKPGFSLTISSGPNTHATTADEDNFYSPKSWRGILVRASFWFPLLFFLIMIIYYATPKTGTAWSTTGLLDNLFYLVILAGTVVIFPRYMLSRTSPSTIIPCANSAWYKLLTCFIWALMALIVIIASIETRKTTCGIYTTYPKSFNSSICPGSAK
jgi:hypothetical protein